MNDLNRRGFMGSVAALFGAAYLPRVERDAFASPMITESQRGFWGVHSYEINASTFQNLTKFNCILYSEEAGRQVEHKLFFICKEKEWVVTEKPEMFNSRPYKRRSVMSDVVMPPYYESQDLEFWESGTKNVADIYDMAKRKGSYDIVVRFSSLNDPNFFKGVSADHKNILRLNGCEVTDWCKKIYPPEITRKGRV